ncbi:MAG TPA: bifunctional phosphopantothenoylcysteine decarboxylase/phosphopantothenate--cysteine ligase CoaBC [Gallionellaceae bacterium]|nr:bifunctional phosphopantothenoylcysteine decarboxylase/phosphopantothenate--cysteine ligase CoaBC [Gallionellaceae bacterium]
MKQAHQKRIVLGLTGGIAAYKAAELARLLIKQGVGVQVAMTEAACHFITPATMQALTGHPVLVNQWDGIVQSDTEDNGMAHISASRAADAIVIAPATADFIAKLAHGLADDLLSTLCLARDCPLLVAPAMNRQMWANAATQRNIAQLERDGVTLLGPASGAQACGEEGMGRMLEAEELARDIAAFLQGNISLNVSSPTLTLPRRERESGQRMDGVKVLITAGPTYEAIDTVRGITNRSSGKMGYAVAQAALELGADVILVSGPTALDKPQGAQVVNITSATEMFEAVKQRAADADIFIGVAAVADYRVATPSVQKIKKGADSLMLELVPNQDILAYVASLPKPPFCVGFAAESEKLHEYATAKRRAKKIPLLAANLAQGAIGSDENELVLFDDAGEHILPRADKLTLARQLIQHAVTLCRQGVKK